MSLWTIKYPRSAVCALALAFGPSVRANLVGIESDTGNLYAVSTTDASLTLITNTGITGLASLEFLNGSLYGFTQGTDPTLYELATDGSIVGSIPLGADVITEGALVFGPDGVAYGMSDSVFSFAPVLFSFDLATGAVLDTVPVDTGTAGALDINGLAWLSGDTLNNGQLLAVDRFSNSLLTISTSTGDTAFFSAVPNTVGGVGGMAVDAEGQVFFSTAGPGGLNPGSNLLYRIDPDTKVITPIGEFSVDNVRVEGVGISGLAIIPEPAALSLLALGGLSLLRRRR